MCNNYEKCKVCGGTVSPRKGNVHEAGIAYHWACFRISYGWKMSDGTPPPKVIKYYSKIKK